MPKEFIGCLGFLAIVFVLWFFRTRANKRQLDRPDFIIDKVVDHDIYCRGWFFYSYYHRDYITGICPVVIESLGHTKTILHVRKGYDVQGTIDLIREQVYKLRHPDEAGILK